MSAIRAIHVGRRQLGMDEEDARDLYERVTGKRSLKLMNVSEQNAVVQELRNKGFTKSINPSAKKLQGQYAPKLQALWIALWNMGAVRQRDDAALLAFVKRQTGVDHTRFLHHSQDARKAIEALKSWLQREGVDWNQGKHKPVWMMVDGYRIAIAQWWKLHQDENNPYQGFGAFVRDQTGRDFQAIATNGEWIPVMNALGQQIRSAK